MQQIKSICCLEWLSLNFEVMILKVLSLLVTVAVASSVHNPDKWTVNNVPNVVKLTYEFDPTNLNPDNISLSKINTQYFVHTDKSGNTEYLVQRFEKPGDGVKTVTTYNIDLKKAKDFTLNAMRDCKSTFSSFGKTHKGCKPYSGKPLGPFRMCNSIYLFISHYILLQIFTAMKGKRSL